MATSDIDPCRGTLGLENEKFAVDCNGKTTVRVSDDCSLEVLESILTALGGNTGTAVHVPGTDVTVAAGTAFNIISVVVPAATTRTISKVIVSTRASGLFELKVGGVVVGSGRTGAGNQNVEFSFSPGLDVATGVTIDVEFTMLFGAVGQCVDAYLMATDV